MLSLRTKDRVWLISAGIAALGTWGLILWLITGGAK